MPKPSTRIHTIIDDLNRLIAEADDDDGPCATRLIGDARDTLWKAFEDNLQNEQEAARDRAEERRTMRAENGYPQ